MLSRTLFHSFRPFSSAAEVTLKANLTKVLEDEVLKKPMYFQVDNLSIQTILKGGIQVDIFPGAEDTNTVVAVSKNGVSVERELNETWLKNWYTSKATVPSGKVRTSQAEGLQDISPRKTRTDPI